MLLFQRPTAVLGRWIHYLVFDLFIGAWIVRDSERHAISHRLVLPCLFFTLIVASAGSMLYLVLRLALRRSWSLVEVAA